MAQTRWRKSRFSSESDGNCVEVAFSPVEAVIRDSKNPDGPQLSVPAAGWLSLTKLTRR